ncbi:cortex morphogenetic protein CmpA [Paenibacillus eucommiae]|uniref:Cortex morphogenetic protein CmpA n=1 Tax=Paenibacillus eucommiae TaxID=1355755 RepID=A0ABS4IZX7_9BACL|nr:cortex morphogenetic protein CmpA [Paenibacillus eucommiae]MBP1993137.1 hypothetical protein [Paenibacillus eucommiae]
MPQWLSNQIMGAFLNKNKRQIRLLNDSWFFYRTRSSDNKQWMDPHTTEHPNKLK